MLELIREENEEMRQWQELLQALRELQRQLSSTVRELEIDERERYNEYIGWENSICPYLYGLEVLLLILWGVLLKALGLAGL